MHPLTKSLFDFSQTLAKDLLKEVNYPWESLALLSEWLNTSSGKLPSDFQQLQPGVWVGAGTNIAASAFIQRPAIIGRNCDIRHNAFIRSNVLIGDGVVVGNATELKQCILFNGVQVPHFNYVGDSIMGYKAHLGAGAILSNFKSTADEISVFLDGEKTLTGLNKLGGLLGDFAEIGCNAVLYPGTIVGRRCVIYPLVGVRGTIPERTIVKPDGSRYPRS